MAKIAHRLRCPAHEFAPETRPSRVSADRDTADSRDREGLRANSDLATSLSHVADDATFDPRHDVDIMWRVAVGRLRIPLSELLVLAAEELPKPTQISLSEIPVGEDPNRMTLHASTFHGSTILTPLFWKSFTLRVAHTAPHARQIAAI